MLPHGLRSLLRVDAHPASLPFSSHLQAETAPYMGIRFICAWLGAGRREHSAAPQLCPSKSFLVMRMGLWYVPGCLPPHTAGAVPALERKAHPVSERAGVSRTTHRLGGLPSLRPSPPATQRAAGNRSPKLRPLALHPLQSPPARRPSRALRAVHLGCGAAAATAFDSHGDRWRRSWRRQRQRQRRLQRVVAQVAQVAALHACPLDPREAAGHSPLLVSTTDADHVWMVITDGPPSAGVYWGRVLAGAPKEDGRLQRRGGRGRRRRR